MLSYVGVIDGTVVSDGNCGYDALGKVLESEGKLPNWGTKNGVGVKELRKAILDYAKANTDALARRIISFSSLCCLTNEVDSNLHGIVGVLRMAISCQSLAMALDTDTTSVIAFAKWRTIGVIFSLICFNIPERLAPLNQSVIAR